MASYTENLNLLKKDPVADGADTFNITTMLNENWDKIDAAKGQIDSALSNKADLMDHRLKTYVGLSQIGQTAGTETIEGIATGLQDGSCVDFFVDAGYNLEIYPDYWEPSRLGMCHVVRMTVSRVIFQFFSKGTSNFPAQMWIGHYSRDSGWTGWFQIATATPPQEYNLPLTSYVTALYGCRYSRDQFGRVVCYGTMEPTREITTGITLATLPAGYRPTNTLRVAGIVVSQDGYATAIGIGVSTTGEISVRGDSVPSTAQYVTFSVVFQGG